MKDVRDAEEFEDAWRGTHDVRAAAWDFRDQLPRFEYVRQVVDASTHLRNRGMTSLADRAERLGSGLLGFTIERKIAAVAEGIEHQYEQLSIPFRAKNTFLKHVAALVTKETALLPYPGELAAELMIIIELPLTAGGGWDAAMRYLEGLPEGFVKVFACMRLCREMNHVATPTDGQLLRFIRAWEKAFVACRSEIPDRGVVRPNEELVELGSDQGEWLRTTRAGRGEVSVTPDARLAFEQEQLSAMFFCIPWSAGEELRALKDRYAKALARDSQAKSYLAPKLVPTMYDPIQYIEEVVIKRNRDPKRVYSLYHDPNIIPLRVEVSRLANNPQPAAVKSVGKRIEQAIELAPRIMRAEYIPLLIELSEVAAGAQMGSSVYYDMARDLSDEVRKVDATDFRRRFIYDGMNPQQKSFDLNARLRRYQATWERTGLVSFARLAATAEPQAVAHYLDEIHRIVDNESIFDIVESRDYAEAAHILDTGPLHSALVFDLFQRAVQTRTREQYEASYDIDHELAVRIDASRLDVPEKDELLEQLVEVNFQRVFKTSMHGLARQYEEELFFSEMDRILQPFMFMLDLVQERGYVGTEQKLWQGLARLSTGIVDTLPTYAHGIALSLPALLAVVRHPEVVHPDNRNAVAALFDNPMDRQDADLLFTSPFSYAGAEGYSHLPTAWKIRKADQKGLEREFEEYFKKVLSEVVPDGRAPDAYILGLLNVLYLCQMRVSLQDADSQPFGSVSEFCGINAVRRILGKFGFTGRQFDKFAVQYPLAAEQIFFSHLDRTMSRRMRLVLTKLAADQGLPVKVRQAAFGSFVRSGFVSDYVQGQFLEAASSPEAMKEFLDSTECIFRIEKKEGEETRLVVYPDWLVAPLFEEVISDERSGLEEAVRRNPLKDLDEFEVAERFEEENLPAFADLKYAVFINSLDDYRRATTEMPSDDDEPYFLEDLIGEYAPQLSYYRTSDPRQLADEDLVEVDYEKRARANASELIETYRRNRVLVRVSSMRLPAAMQNIDARLRFVISSYISHIPASTRLLLQAALRKSEAALKEEDVLRVFFEQTGLEKLVQFLSLQDGVVPDSYRAPLKRFQEDLKPSTHREVVDTISANGLAQAIRLNGDGTLVSRHAGTVGELWEGMLVDGERVAIKVLPAKKRRRNEQALRALKRVTEDLHLFRHRLFGGIDFNDLYKRYHDSLLAEMDYLNEVQNIRELAPAMQRHGIVYPRVHEALERRDVMVMDYIDFAEIADIKGEAERQGVVDRTGAWLAAGIFEDGIFYEDFHPGNIKWLEKSGNLLMLDFGRIGRLDERQRDSLVRLLIAGATGDANAARDALIAMSPAGLEEADRKGLADEVGKVLAGGESGNASAKIQKIFAAAARCGADPHPNYLQFMKAVVSWEAVMRQLKPDADFATYAAPVILRRMAGSDDGGGNTEEGGSPGSAHGPVAPAQGDEPAIIPDESASDADLEDQMVVGGLSVFSGAAPMPVH
ncbi:MAG: AarF/UbiB family protein [bacterium]